ncbi:MAG: hypothetical protein M3Z03_06635 [Actinomycetota bacterium]|nr:hypothetical protein [Actinomycetota bacterium]
MRRALKVGLVWVLVLGVTRLFVLSPERCAVPTSRELAASVSAAIGWFDRNQLPAGNVLYAYERATDEAIRAEELVRPQGVLLSLYQAARDGYPDALAIADRALPWSLDRLVDTGDGGRAVALRGQRAPTGASALLVAALVERRLATGDTEHDELIASLARFLLGQVEGSGAVRSSWDPATGPVPAYSIFFTGETMWALTRAARVEPDGPWAAAAERISRYLVDRNQAEGRLPFLGDHWAGYGLDELTAVAGPRSEDELVFARTNASLFDMSIRFESQNTGRGLIRLTRGEPSLGAGVGTLGEGAGGLQRLAEQDDRLADLREPLRHTVGCVAGVLVDRQMTEADVGDGETGHRVVGAWFRDGRTQLDDQQHALSALLAAGRVGAVGGTDSDDRPSHVDHGGMGGWLTVVLTLVAASNAVRRRGRDEPGGTGLAVVTLVVVGLALVLVARPLLDLLDITEPTARVAAGVAVLVTAIVDLVNPRLMGLSVMRPGVALAVLVAAIDPGRAQAALAVVVAGLVAALVGRAAGDDERWTRAARWLAVVGIVMGADLVVDGIYDF